MFLFTEELQEQSKINNSKEAKMAQKVSIITATYNNAIQLKEIAENVLKQDYKNIEYIIVDGGSTDQTPQVIEEIKDWFGDRMKVISEPDKGIYDALNKGILAATGDVIGCCYDQFTSTDVISKMISVMEQEGSDGVHADIHYMQNGSVIRKWHQGQGNIRFGWLPGHPTLYLRKKIYDQYGLYKVDYKIAADYEFMIRILKDHKVKLSYIPEVLINMEHGGTSTNSLSAYMLSLKEGHRALVENHVAFAWFTDCCRTARVLLQFLIK